MTAVDVVGVVSTLESEGIDVWLDGGWGVDALLEEQTRPHDDIDIVLDIDAVPLVREIFEGRDFQIIEGEPPHHFVLAHTDGRKIDVHAVRFDEAGNGIYHMETGRDWPYPAEGFAGTGMVDERPVRCLTPEVQVICHNGYELDENDFHDMEALHRRFGVELLPVQKR
jgi:lincosamide nucleotidyltransferase A/C/D/E